MSDLLKVPPKQGLDAPPAPAGGFLEGLGLHRPELRAWALYDWANSAVWTTVVAAVFPIYFSQVVSADLGEATGTARFALATTLGLVLVAVLAPLLGAAADYAGAKKKMLATFLGLGAVATASLFFIQRGDWLPALILFILIEIGVSGTIVFYDALLPHVARDKEVDRVSAAGFALGYLGGGILLALNLAWIQWPAWFGLPTAEGGSAAEATLPVRLAFVSVAVWWLVFSAPLFFRVSEPPRRLAADERSGQNLFRAACHRLRKIVGELRGYKQAFLLLLAFLIYSDGIGTVYRMAAIYGAEIGIDRGWLIGSILLVQFVGIPFTLLFGRLADWVGVKPAIFVALGGYLCAVGFAFFISTAVHFLILAILVGTVQGGAQSLSRSLFASMIPKHKSAEFFAFFSVSEKVAGILGPVVFAAIITLTGSSRYGIVSVVLFFVVGGLLLSWVDVESGQRAAREANSLGPAVEREPAGVAP